MNIEYIKKYLDNPEKKIILLYETDSTNSYAKELAKNGECDGTVIIAETQTNGRGRLGRVFQSPKGSGIYMSVIVRKNFKPDITACTAVAVAEAVDKVCGTDTLIKWVNDIYLNEHKICGILTEASMSQNNYYAVIGIGLNVGSVKESFDSKLLKTASSIEDETGKKFNRSQICAEIINSLERHLEQIETRLFIEKYRKRSFLIGKEVTVLKGSEERNACVLDIDENACLKVRYNDGSEEVLNSGEARLIRK